MMPLPNKRFICSIVKRKEGVLKADVVVVTAKDVFNARVILCEKYNIPNIDVVEEYTGTKYSSEGIKSIRVSETNTYESDAPEFDNFRDGS